MQKNKGLFFLLNLLCIFGLKASIQPVKVPIANATQSTIRTAGDIASFIGLVQIIGGTCGYFQSSDDSLTTKTLTDYEKSELTSMTKEKLAKLIARENERSKNTLAAFEVILSGIFWLSIGRIAEFHGTRFLKDFQDQQLKTTSA